MKQSLQHGPEDSTCADRQSLREVVCGRKPPAQPPAQPQVVHQFIYTLFTLNTPVEPLSGVYIVTLFPTRGGFCLAVHTCMSHPLSCPSPSLILRRGISPTEREKRQLKQPGKREGRRRGQRKERGSNRENMTLLEPWQFECGS